MNALRWKPPFKPNVPSGVMSMVENLGDEMPDGGRAYLRLARDVSSFLEARSLWTWGQLDVETFVFLHAEGMAEAIEVCCNLAAMLPHLVASGELSAVEATGFWVALFDVCPEDDAAQLYILEGLERFGDLEALVKVQLEGWEVEPGPEATVVASGRGLSVVPEMVAVGAEVAAGMEREMGRRRAEVLPTRWVAGE